MSKASTKPKPNLFERNGLLIPIEVAKIYGVTISLIHRWCREGRFPNAEKLPGYQWVIPKTDIKKYERRGPGRPSIGELAARAS